MWKKKKLYFSYIGFSILYVAIKIVFVSFGYLHLGAIAHGSVPAFLTILVCLFAIKENANNNHKYMWHWLMLILPLLVLIVTPLYMYLKSGDTWLVNGRLPVLIIYEIMAIIQSAIAFVAIKRIKG